MNKGTLKSWGLLLLAIILGAGTYFGANHFFKEHEKKIRAELESKITSTKSIVVSSRDIQAGEIISAENMAIATVPSNFLPDGHVEPPMFDAMSGKELIYPMSQGTPLLQLYVGGNYADRFSDLIKKGHRPLTVEVDTINSNEGMIEVGDYVDLLLMVSGESEGVERLENIAENVNIVATGRTRSVSAESNGNVMSDGGQMYGYSTITVILPSDTAARVLLAQENGTLVTFLRNQEDKAKLGFDAISFHQMQDVTAGTIQYFTASNSDGANLKPKYVNIIGNTKSKIQNARKWNEPELTVSNTTSNTVETD
ncbi:Flp pilus assembly protein CpaB [Motilimonas pumila]|uniref:Flp pilus assembly protein CpaB n=1 Tax=Motilimonas pumila TaxID=2303987 RepID=A0A418YAG1_9GAMM|nr:Flp pilus assembly protein CpaB [Motilimonas pumila]RJG39514.1 Flp pilus assembly protein CpaB [Motilimonas pumila]